MQVVRAGGPFFNHLSSCHFQALVPIADSPAELVKVLQLSFEVQRKTVHQVLNAL